MTLEQQERAKVLMQAALDILNKCDGSFFIISALEATAIWDDAECDGYCLKEDLEQLIDEINAG